MPEFVAQSDPLTYDFTRYVEGAKGVIPEPTSRQIREFFRGLRELSGIEEEQTKAAAKNRKTTQRRAGSAGIGGRDFEALLAVLDRPDEEFEESDRRAAELVALLCSGQPDVEVLNKLPSLVFSSFLSWILAQVQNPERFAPATSNSPGATPADATTS